MAYRSSLFSDRPPPWKGWRYVLLAVVVVVYLVGVSYGNAMVRGACWHGNCIHGWNSKYNGTERAIATSWIFGFPLATGYIWFRIHTRKSRRL
jgi:hypothetical protein